MLLSLQRSLLLLLLYTAVQCKAWSQTHPTVWQSGNKAVAALTVGFRQFPSAHGGEIFYYVKIKLWMVHWTLHIFAQSLCKLQAFNHNASTYSKGV